MRICQCLSPLLLPALGLIVGVILSLFMPGGAWWSLCAKLLMVCYGLQGWAIGVCFIQQKRLYCGATETINNNDWPAYSRRYGYGVMIVSAGFILATIGLLGAANMESNAACGLMIYFFFLPFTFAFLVGEIGWEEPLKFFKMFTKINGK